MTHTSIYDGFEYYIETENNITSIIDLTHEGENVIGQYCGEYDKEITEMLIKKFDDVNGCSRYGNDELMANMNKISKDLRCEFIGQIMDVIDDVLEQNGISFPNNEELQREAGMDDKEIAENAAILFGENYDMFADPITEIMYAWDVLEEEM